MLATGKGDGQIAADVQITLIQRTIFLYSAKPLTICLRQYGLFLVAGEKREAFEVMSREACRV